MKKEEYSTPSLKIVIMADQDVITTSDNKGPFPGTGAGQEDQMLVGE